jgi:uncharacterized protein (TIGR02391 family)
MQTLFDVFSDPPALLRLEPEELGGILLELAPKVAQNGLFSGGSFVPDYQPVPVPSWQHHRRGVSLAVAEAMGWLVSQGLIMRDPAQPGSFFVLTRRGQSLKNRIDVEAYRKGGVLPIQLLQPELAEKVHHLFVRGDHDVAVFQAFKTLEVAVRKAGGYDNTVIGKRLVTRAFNPDDGPLRDSEATQDEREAEMALFVGAIGHCKNPASHRDVDLEREEAARLIVFASHLLAIVEERANGF